MRQRRPETQIEVALPQAKLGDGGSLAGGARECQPEDQAALGLSPGFPKAARLLTSEKLYQRFQGVCTCTPTKT